MGNTIRIYYPCPYRGAYAYVENEIVTHASVELGFTIGWTKARLLERAAAVGFRTATNLRMTAPNPRWVSRNTKDKKHVD